MEFLDSRSRRTRERLLGCLLAVLTLGLWPVAFWHDATTRHEVCPAHGELLDVASAPAEDHDLRDDGPRWTGAGDDEGGHEQCPFVALAQPSSPASEPQTTGEAVHEPAAAVSRACEVRRTSIPLLLLAPKQSPPV